MKWTSRDTINVIKAWLVASVIWGLIEAIILQR